MPSPNVSKLSIALSVITIALASGYSIYIKTFSISIEEQMKLSQEDCVFSAVKEVVEAAIDKERRIGASLIRLFFHDCFVDGCDGGVLLNDIDTFTGEQSAPANANSIRGFTVIDEAKENVVNFCPDIDVSCADILAIAARDSVVKLGGKAYKVKLGRRDARSANLTGAINQLVGPSEDLESQTKKFSTKGFDQKEMVTLVGAHTVGFSRCVTLCNTSNTNPKRYSTLQCDCNVTPNVPGVVPLDPSPETMDQRYFENVAKGQGLLFSDNELLKSDITAAVVARYKDNVGAFFKDFAAAMVKMGNLPPSEGVELEIRDVCNQINSISVVADA